MWHEDEVAPWKCYEGRKSGAFAPYRVFGGLDEEVLPFLEKVLYGGVGRHGAFVSLDRQRPFNGDVLLGLRREERLVSVMYLFDIHIRHIEETRLIQADIDEGRLHAGQHLNNPSLVDVPGDSQFSVALDVELRYRILLQKGDAGFVLVGVHNDLHCQPSSLLSRQATATFSTSKPASSSPSSPW